MSIIVPIPLAAAIEAAQRTPLVRVLVDWDGDGFGPPGSLDDLSGKQGQVSIGRQLITDLPDPVRLTEGASAATATVALVEGDVMDEAMHAARYFTRGTDSPVGHLERLNLPAAIDIGFATEQGPMYVRRLTGRTRNMPTSSRNRTAQLTMLDNRARLRNPVQLIPTDGTKAGCNGTWLVFQALYANGVAAGPIPGPGLLMWTPGYGSIQPWVPSAESPTFGVGFRVNYATGAYGAPQFVAGPFVLAPNAFYHSDFDVLQPIISKTVVLAPGQTWDGLSARFEVWTIGATSPTAGPTPSTGRVFCQIYNSSDAASGKTVLGVRHNGKLFCDTYDTNFTTLLVAVDSDFVVPSDGAWHAVGVHVDLAAGQVTFRLDGAQQVKTATFNLALISRVPDSITGTCWVPSSDFFLHACPVTSPWRDQTLNIEAVLDRSRLDMVAVAEPLPFDPQQLLSELAGAEQATAVWDEAGVFRYRNRGRLTDAAGATAQRALTTADASLLDVDISDGVDQVRNIVQVTYTPVSGVSLDHSVLVDDTQRILPTGTLTFVVAFTDLVVQLSTISFPHSVTEWKLFGPGGTATPPVDLTPFIALTTHSDFTTDDSDPAGLLAMAWQNLVHCNVTSWNAGTATVTVVSTAPVTLYIAHLSLHGRSVQRGNPVLVDVRDQASIAQHGPQGIQLQMPNWVQTPDVAQGLAATLLGDLSQPRPTVTGLRITGDPRRQLGDRVILADPDGTQLRGEFWLTQINDEVSNAGAYTQTIAARQATNVMMWDVGAWDVDTWG